MNARERAVAAWADSDWAEVAAYLGPNAERFRPAYERGREKALERGVGNVFGWSWPALVFGFAWFLYRKQWAIGAVLIVLPLLIAYFVDIGGGLGGVAIVMAMFAKSFVVQDAVTRIAKLKTAGASMPDIAAAGGVSVPGGIIGGMLWLVALVGAVLTLMMPAAP